MRTGDLPQRERCERATREECTASYPWGRAHRPEQSVSDPAQKTGSRDRHTMIRSFPKLGCGVAEGLGITIVGAAIYLFGGEGKTENQEVESSEQLHTNLIYTQCLTSCQRLDSALMSPEALKPTAQTNPTGNVRARPPCFVEPQPVKSKKTGPRFNDPRQ